MKRATWLVCVALAAGALASCGRKPGAPAPQGAPPDGQGAPLRGGPAPAAEEPADPDPSDVGVGDVVDYAIGKTQLEMKKQIEAQIDEVKKDREKRIEEALGE